MFKLSTISNWGLNTTSCFTTLLIISFHTNWNVPHHILSATTLSSIDESTWVDPSLSPTFHSEIFPFLKRKNADTSAHVIHNMMIISRIFLFFLILRLSQLIKIFAYFLTKYIVQNVIYKSIFYFIDAIMSNWLWYIILLIYIAITFRSVLMWMDKMAKLIIGNYLAWITCYAFGNLINQWVLWLLTSPSSEFIWISYAKLASFLSAGQLTFVLLLFVGLIRLIHACWRIQVTFWSRASTEKLYFIILIPITVLSFVIGPYIALQANWIQAISFIETSLIGTFGFMYQFIHHLPFWMLINGLVFIIISSHIDFKISLSAKATKLPEWM